MLAAGRLSSIVFWGGPGTGKTSIARLLADAAGLRFKSISAVTTNVSELKSVFAEAKMLAESGKRTALFIDEIHRSEEHPSELQSLMRISYAVFCLQKKKQNNSTITFQQI